MGGCVGYVVCIISFREHGVRELRSGDGVSFPYVGDAGTMRARRSDRGH